MSRPFYCFSKFALVFGTNASSFFWPDFSQAGNKAPQHLSIFKINLLYIFLAEIARHFYSGMSLTSISSDFSSSIIGISSLAGAEFDGVEVSDTGASAGAAGLAPLGPS